jgi:L-fuculose-phosphate aldolase
MYLSHFQAVGRTLADRGLVTGASGNLSVRNKDRIIITSHGSVLSSLNANDLVETGSEDDDPAPRASWELPVHRAIYRATGTDAIVHAHLPAAVTLTLTEGFPAMPGNVAVVGTNTQIVAGILPDEIARELKKHPLVMVKGHGSFATGKTLEEACELTVNFEEACAALCRQNVIAVQEVKE